MRIRAALASVVLAACGAGVAQAQPTAGAKDDTTGVFCVYNALVAAQKADLVARAYLDEETPDELVTEAADLLSNMGQSCAETHMLSQGKMRSMGIMGLYGPMIDHLGKELRKAGASAKAVKAVYAAYDALSEEDHVMFREEEWRDDANFTGKLRKKLTAAGIPKKDEAIDMAMTLLEASSMADRAIFDFLVDDL